MVPRLMLTCACASLHRLLCFRPHAALQAAGCGPLSLRTPSAPCIGQGDTLGMQAVMSHAEKLVAAGVSPSAVGIISPYNGQASEAAALPRAP